jgi:hypothetical protein
MIFTSHSFGFYLVIFVESILSLPFPSTFVKLSLLKLIFIFLDYGFVVLFLLMKRGYDFPCIDANGVVVLC